MQSLGMKKHTMNWRKLPGRTWFIKYSGVQNILFLRCTECVAIGECGLDFNRNFSPPDVQIEVFEKQVVNFTSIVAYILLSVRWRLHVNLENPCSFMKETHIKKWCPFLKDLWISRKKDKKMQNLLKSFFRLPSCVIHCFTGNREQAIKYLQLGCYIGLTGYLWKDKSENGVRRILEEGVIPLDKLLVETDAPFMYPNTRASKLPQHIKDCLTERSVTFLQRYCTFQVRHFLFPKHHPSYQEKRLLLARACGVPAVGVRSVDCWQWRSGHYSHQSFPFSPFSVFSALRFSHRRSAWIKKLI